ncbi:MAG: MFS transporter [Proteobacteria bacterium]|nr:MFS transporter [Pseudomonadota bacterium]
MRRDRLVPLIIAVALFMENMDSTVIATSLPAIAKDIGTDPLALKLAVTSYLLSLAVFIPASGWTADRFGARTVFRAAIAVFVIGSIGCALSSSLTDFVFARILQGMGGAMMSPVGRMVLVRTISKRELVSAMAWVTTPALIGPVIGPPVGGFITTYATWHWIFLINVPIGIVGIYLATRFIENVRAEKHEPFDIAGMVYAGFGIAGLAFGLSVAGLNFLPWSVVAALVIGGAIFIVAYLVHAKRTPVPALDLTLFRLTTFRAAVVGGFIFRLGIGALPFLLPLMLQLGFGLSPFHSGLITFASAAGAMGMKAAASTLLRRFGFRNILLFNAFISAGFLAVCGFFTATTPAFIMLGLLLVGGFFRSLQFTSINTLAYAEVEHERVSRATSLVAVGQQLAMSSGVAVGALAVDLTAAWHGHAHQIVADDFPMAFFAVAAISLCSVLYFMQLPHDAGAEISGRGLLAPKSTASSDHSPPGEKN